MALNAAARGLPATLATLSCLMLPWRRRRRALTFLAALGVITLLVVGCSGSHPANSGTPPGNYTVSVTGKCGDDAAPITHKLAVAVQVL
jgi:hypothetical protein